MRTLTAEDQAHVQEACTTWALCWKITLGDEVLRITTHDAAITMALTSDEYDLNGTYTAAYTFQASALRTSADLAVDNMEVDALLDSAGITEQEIVTGVYDHATYALALVNWRDSTNSGVVMKRGVVGNIRAFAESVLKGELRGLSQKLSQTTIETYGPSCRAELGDARCKVNLADFTITGDIDSIEVQRRVFTTAARLADSSSSEAKYFEGGKLTMTSGNNAGFSVEVKTDDGSGQLILFEPMPFDWQIGDTYSLVAGCDKRRETCRDKFANIVNRRAEDFIPSGNRLIAGAA